MNSGANRDVIELWGREFNVVKSGLSEAQVVSFVNELVKQHDTLFQRQEHLAALTKLAERTVAEADKLAEEMKKEASDRAKSEAAKIIADAEGTARSETARVLADAQARAEKIVKERETQAAAAAAKEAEAIKAESERLAAEVKKAAEGEAARITAEAESRGRHIMEQKEAEAAEKAGQQAKDILSRAQAEASMMLEREKEKIQPELGKFVRRLHSQLLSELDNLRHQVGSLESEFEQTFSPTDSKPGPEPAVSQDEQGEKPEELLDLVGSGTDADTGEPEWEVEILPPIDIMKIMSIVGHLDSLPEVVKTEIIPRNDRTSVTVYLNDPVELVDMIKGLPEVARAEETTAADDGNLRKISLSLSGKAGPDERPSTTEYVDTAVHDRGK